MNRHRAPIGRIVFLILVAAVLAGCGPSFPSVINATSTHTPAPTSSSTVALTPTSTPLPTATATPNPVLSQGDPSRIVELQRLGKGMPGEAVWSPDAKTILIPYSTGIYRFDSKTLTELEPFETTDPAYYTVFSPDGSTLASTTGEGDPSILLWRASDGERIGELQGPVKQEEISPNNFYISQPSGFRQIQFSPNGKRLAALADESIHVWDVETGEYEKVIEAWQGFTSFVFLPDGSGFLTDNRSGAVRSFAASDGALLKTYRGFGGYGTSLKFSPDGGMLALGSSGSEIQLWSMPDGAFLRKMNLPGKAGLADMDFSPDGSQLAGLSDYGEAYSWQTADGKILFQTEPGKYIGTSRSVSAPGDWGWASQRITFSPDGSSLIEQIGDNSVRIRNAVDWSVTEVSSDCSYPAKGITFTPGGNSLEVIDEKTLNEYSAAGGELLSQVPLPVGFGGPFYAFSADGSLVASDCDKTNVEYACVWTPADGSLRLSNLSGRYVLTGLDLSSDGRLLAAMRYPEETTRLWSVTEGKILRGFDGRIAPKFSPDGSIIALSEGQVWETVGGMRGFHYDYRIHFLEVSTGHETGLIALDGPAGWIYAKAYSPDGKILAVVSSGQKNSLRLWSVPEGRLIRQMDYLGQQGIGKANYPASVVFSADGKIVAVGDAMGIIRIWRAEDGKLLRELDGHMYSVPVLAFSPDGKWLASSSADGTVRIWGIR
jgi:WD40 repeat protein